MKVQEAELFTMPAPGALILVLSSSGMGSEPAASVQASSFDREPQRSMKENFKELRRGSWEAWEVAWSR
jgi:hypothetical protein